MREGTVRRPADDSAPRPPREKPDGGRTPYPVDHPGISQQPGSEPDVLPGKDPASLPKF